MLCDFLRRVAQHLCVCNAVMNSRDCTPQCRVILGGEGNALYPVLSSTVCMSVCLSVTKICSIIADEHLS